MGSNNGEWENYINGIREFDYTKMFETIKELEDFYKTSTQENYRIKKSQQRHISIPNDVLENSLTEDNKWVGVKDSELSLSDFLDDESIVSFTKTYETQLPMTEVELISGISVDGAKEEEITDWLASVLIEYDVSSIEMSFVTFMNLLSVINECFDDSSDLWGISTIMNNSLEDHKIIFNYDGINY